MVTEITQQYTDEQYPISSMPLLLLRRTDSCWGVISDIRDPDAMWIDNDDFTEECARLSRYGSRNICFALSKGAYNSMFTPKATYLKSKGYGIFYKISECPNGGAVYNCPKYKGVTNHYMLLCEVIRKIYGEFPDVIYFRLAE